MKIFLKYTLALITIGVFALALTECKKAQQGYLSPYLYYEQNPMYIARGREYSGYAVNPNGSTRPLQIKLLHVYNKATGQNVDDIFFKKYPLQIWIGHYDPKVDTTNDMISAIRKTIDTLGIAINNVSGQVQSNAASYFIPAGEYTFDLQISNINSIQVYPHIGEIILNDTTPYDRDPGLGSPYDRLYKVGNESVVKSARNPIVYFARVADTPNVIMVKFVDKNGVPFDPKSGEINRRPYPGLNPPQPYLQTMQDYCPTYKATDTTMNFYYPFLPFPLGSLGNGFNYYYRIPTQYVHFDNFPDNTYSANPRFVGRFYVSGEYSVVIQLPDVTHR